MGSVVLGIEHRQQQGLSPRLQHAVRLLQLSSLDFAQEVRDALGRNPFLETDEASDEVDERVDAGSDSSQDHASIDPEAIPAAGESVVTKEELDPGIDGGERDPWVGDAKATRHTDDDDGTGVLDTLAATPSLAGHLHAQLDVLPLEPRDRLLAKAVVESLDDDGYLRFELPELRDAIGLDPMPSDDELQIALKRVQALEPAGVAARTVAECLRLQLSTITCPDQRGQAARIIDGHLDRLAAKDVAGLARVLGCTAAIVEAVCDRIRHLDPRPGWRFGSSPARYVTPDVIVRKVRGEWTVTLNPMIAPRVRLNRVYAEMYQRHRARAGSAANAELAAHLQEARWTMRNIEQRFATILGVAGEIVRRQRHFFDYGSLAMKPLGLREVATEVGIHESTVSRVTNNKYMATPLGVFELKYFFSRALVTASGSACSGTAIRGLIKEMIEGESPVAPLSDAEIARQLARQGLVVARRTVTKYRQLLRLEAVERRRRHV